MADIYVYGPIGDSWDPEAMTAAEFARQLRAAGDEDVTVHVNSAGGDVFDANAMAELVRAREGRVTAVIEDLAASAASYFALTADEVLMNPSAMLMVHNPWASCVGSSAEMRSTADLLDKVRATIVRQYVSKTGLPEADVEELMDAETWMDARKAVELGFADEIMKRAEAVEVEEDLVPPEDGEAFSEAAVVNSLMDKLAAKCKIRPKTDGTPKIKADSLMERLNLLKNWR